MAQLGWPTRETPSLGLVGGLLREALLDPPVLPVGLQRILALSIPAGGAVLACGCGSTPTNTSIAADAESDTATESSSPSSGDGSSVGRSVVVLT